MNNKSIRMRRHHRKRIINKRKNDMTYYKESPIGKHITHPVKCSGPCCGNPRNHYGNSQMSKTFQELKSDSIFTESIENNIK